MLSAGREGGTSKVHVILIVTRRELSPRWSWSRALVGLGIRGTRRLWLDQDGMSGECPVVQPSEILSKGLIKVIASQPCTKRAEV